MAAVFGSMVADVGIAFFLGLLGGVAAELIDNSGKAGIPSVEGKMVNLGIFSKMLIGGIAALAFFFVIDATKPLKFIGAMIAAGFGGSATLVAIKEKILAGKRQEFTKDLSDAATKAIQEARKVVKQPTAQQVNLDEQERNVITAPGVAHKTNSPEFCTQ